MSHRTIRMNFRCWNAALSQPSVFPQHSDHSGREVDSQRTHLLWVRSLLCARHEFSPLTADGDHRPVLINPTQFPKFIHTLFLCWGRPNLALCREHAVFREKTKPGQVLRQWNIRHLQNRTAKAHLAKASVRKGENGTGKRSYIPRSGSGVSNPPLASQALERRCWHWIKPGKENQSAHRLCRQLCSEWMRSRFPRRRSQSRTQSRTLRDLPQVSTSIWK